MPTRAAHPCRSPGCVNLVQSGAYCTEHRRPSQYEEQRASSNDRGYGATWRRLRLMILARDPICVDPFGIHARRGEVVPSVDVDHIIAKADGGLDREDNLRGLCHSCHSRVTASAL